MRRLLLTGFMVFTVSLGAQALTGSGESASGALETVSPTLVSVSAVTERSVSATFSEGMLAPGATTPGNYSASGLGAGTLAAHPDVVSGGGPYTLSWSAGEMQDGASVTVTATGLQDAVGNPINPAQNSASCAGIGFAPVFTNLAASPAQASVTETVTITFTCSESLDGDPDVTVNGHAATWVSGGKAVDYTYHYEVQSGDPLGMASVSVTGFDLAGNLGSLSSDAALEIVEEQAGLPLYAWPTGLALLTAGILMLAKRRRLGAGLLVLALLASTAAFAQTPAVSNVTFSQSPNAGSTQVDIYYDLVAPNGPCDITVSLSKDGGADGYIHPVTSVTGDIAAVTTGTGKHIVWDIRTDYPEEDIPNARIRVLADDGVVQHTLTYLAGPNGSILGPTPQTVNHGADGAPVTAAADPHYHFVQWSDARTDNPRTDTNVTTDITVTAGFAIDTYDITCEAVGNGTCVANPPTVEHGSTSDIVVTPAEGWHIVSVVDSEEGPKPGSYTTTPVTANRTVTATFEMDPPVVTSFAINGGAATTTNPVVTLDNTATNSPTEYMASESPTFSGASWQAYGTGPSFTLSAGTGGTKTVYFKVRNGSGESAPVSDTISLIERTILLPGSVPLVLRWVPSGSYQMGRYPGEADSSSREDPQHPVALAYGFWMGKYEVTQQQWLAVQGSWPGTAPSSTYGLGNTYPAYNVSWNDTKNFITTLNAHIVSSGQGPLTVRLPSEAEWEYACRAGTATRFYFGDSLGCAADCSDCAAGVLPGNRTDYMWYCGNNSPNGTKPVGGKTGNAFGLFDMSGNVYEWCEDDYHSTYSGAPSDGSAWIDSPRASDRMIRGGGWGGNARYCRSAYRNGVTPDARGINIGFRLAAVQ